MTTIEKLRSAPTGQVGTAMTQSLTGLIARTVVVEAVILSGLPNFTIVGLPDAAVGEAKERVRAGFTAVGLPWPNRRLTVNLSPGDVQKTGTSFDLSLAVAILCAMGARGLGTQTIVLGELGLAGQVRPVKGVIPACAEASSRGIQRVVLPIENASQARLIPGIEVVAVSHLSQVAHMCGVTGIDVSDLGVEPSSPETLTSVPELLDVRGQEDAVHGMLVAATGGHHVLMLGPPGVGKSMLAERFPGIMPDLTEEQAVEVATIQSLIGEQFATLPKRPLIESPHHSVTVAALIGGGSGIARPGAITKAHHGVLYCDEFPEFSPSAIQSLRQPMESGRIDLDRVHGKVSYPARFQLIAAANPCRCGRLFDGPGKCGCTSRERRTYQSGLGGPVRDRIDIALTLRRPSRADVRAGGTMSTADALDKVMAARDRQLSRSNPNGGMNRELPGPWLRANTPMPDSFREVIERALAQGDLSMRGVDRILRVAWSIADLAGHDFPHQDDLFRSYAMRQNGLDNQS